MKAFWLWLFALVGAFKDTRTQSCSTQVCFTWNVTSDNLTLICRINKLRFRVKVYDPRGLVQADCTAPYPEVKCEPHYKNVSVQQNVVTKETVVTIHGNIDDNLNGKWTCCHGTGRGNASIAITVFTAKAAAPARTRGDYNCILSTLFLTMVGFITTFVVTLIVTALRQPNTPNGQDTTTHRSMSCRCIPFERWKTIDTKKLIFAVLTLIFFGLTYLVALFDKQGCTVKWILLGLSILIGCLSTILFLTRSRDKYTAVTRNENEETTELADNEPTTQHNTHV